MFHWLVNGTSAFPRLAWIMLRCGKRLHQAVQGYSTLKNIMLATVSAVAVLVSAPASAAVFNFNYTGTGITASGTFTTNDQPNADGFQLVTALTGTRNGLTLSLLPVGTNFDGVATDNRLSASSPYVTFNGLGLRAGNVNYALFFDDFLSDGPLEYTQGDVSRDITLTVTPAAAGAVPETATWALMLAGFGMIGAGLRSRRRSVTFSAA